MNAILLALAMIGGVEEGLNSRQMRIDVCVLRGDPLGSRAAGTVKVLAEPILSCFNGQSGTFLVGSDGRGVAKPFGIQLKLSPVLQAGGKVRLETAATLSEPSEGLGILVGNRLVPGYTERSTLWVQTVNSGEVIRFRLSSESPELQTWVELKVAEAPHGK